MFYGHVKKNKKIISRLCFKKVIWGYIYMDGGLLLKRQLGVDCMYIVIVIYTDTNYVLTTPPQEGQYLPNSPKHQIYGELTYTINKYFRISIGTEYQSEWAIYTDADAYNGELDPMIYQNCKKDLIYIMPELLITGK